LTQAINGRNPNNDKEGGFDSAIMLEATSQFYQGGATSSQIRAASFAEEAVKLITERGYSVTDVAERLGVSQHSIYKWLKAVQPLRNNPDEHELLEAKKEILRLKSQLKQTEEERDILKKAARYFASLPE
jgi:transposase